MGARPQGERLAATPHQSTEGSLQWSEDRDARSRRAQVFCRNLRQGSGQTRAIVYGSADTFVSISR